MSGWSLAAAAVLGGLTLSGVQQPDVTVRAEPIRDGIAMAPIPNIQERVSASFNQASVREVLDWLSKNGVSFVVADGELSKDATVTLNIRNQPASDVADAIAEALGGHWQRRGEIRVFRKGQGNFAFAAPGMPMTMPRVEAFEVPLGQGGRNLYRFDGSEGAKVRTDVKRSMEELHKVLPKMNMQGPEGEKMRIEIERSMAELHKVLPKMHMQGPEGEKMRIELKRSMEELGKELPKIHAEALKSLKEHKLSDAEHKRIKVEIEKAMTEARKDMEKAHKEMERARKEHPEAFVEGHRVFVSPDGEAKTLFVAPRADGQQVFEYRIEGEPSGKQAPKMRMFKGADAMVVGPIADGGLEKLAKGLSPAQKDLHRRQGYLKASDLTPNQRKMLGLKNDKGRWTIKFVKDNDELVIKSDD